jgi:hypothetical protein
LKVLPYAFALLICIAGTSACAHKSAEPVREPASAAGAAAVASSAIMPGVVGRVPLYPSHVLGAATLAMGRYEIRTSDRPDIVVGWYQKHLPRAARGAWSPGSTAGGYRYRGDDGLVVTIGKSGAGTRIGVIDRK